MRKEFKVFAGVLAIFIAVAGHRLGSSAIVMAIGLAPMLGLVMFLGEAERLRSDSWSGRLMRKVPAHKLVLRAHVASMRWGLEVRALIVLALMAWFCLAVTLAG